MRQLAGKDIHEAYNKTTRENDMLLYEAGMAVPRLIPWKKLSTVRKTLYEEMAELLNQKLATEEVPANAK